MRSRWIILFAAVTILGCSPDNAGRLPTSPGSLSGSTPSNPNLPTPNLSGLVWMMAVGQSGGCVDDATLDVVGGQGVGRSSSQIVPCGVWDYEGGIILRDLAPGVELTVRVSAPGYATKEMSLLPLGSATFSTQPATIIEMSRIR